MHKVVFWATILGHQWQYKRFIWNCNTKKLCSRFYSVKLEFRFVDHGAVWAPVF